MNRNFFGQTAVYDSGQYRTEPSCKKAKKSLEPFLRKIANQLTNYQLSITRVIVWDLVTAVAGPKLTSVRLPTKLH